MPGYLYVFGVMTAGLLSVLLLALRAEKGRCRAVEEALAKLPGLRGEDRLFAGRRGLALDRRHGALCLICAETDTVRLHVVPFPDLLACELVADGRVIARADRRGPSVTPPAGGTAAQELRLRLHVGDHYAPRHELLLDALPAALDWHRALARVIETPAPVRLPAPAQPAPSAPALRTALRRQLQEALGGREYVVIPERRLRDCCAADMPLIRFHRLMNRLRREKALESYCLSYSRKGESWRISRRAGRRAAA